MQDLSTGIVEFMSRGAIVAAILEKTTLLKILEH
jgi:hypothetical protein